MKHPLSQAHHFGAFARKNAPQQSLRKKPQRGALVAQLPLPESRRSKARMRQEREHRRRRMAQEMLTSALDALPESTRLTLKADGGQERNPIQFTR